MPSRKRILFLDYTNGIGLGGGQRSLALLLAHLPRERYRPILACPPGERLRAILPGDVAVADLPLDPGFAGLSRFDRRGWRARVQALAAGRGAVARLRGLVAQERVDLIHANNLKMLVLAALAAPRVPVVWHVRDIFPPAAAACLRPAVWLARRVLTVSRAVAGQFGTNSKVQVVYNAVELPAAEEIAWPAAGDGPAAGTGPVVGYAGRLDAGKGLTTLVEAFQRLLERHPGARLLLAGEGPEEARIPDHPAIRRLGFQRDTRSFWNRIDIAVQPSDEPDSFPRAVIEAMSWARPVVGTRVGGIPEAIGDGETGLLVEPGNAAQLSQRLALLAEQPSLGRAMGAAGRERCRQQFSIPAQIRQLTAIYETYAICHS